MLTDLSTFIRVLLDDTDVTRRRGGCGYETFGIDPAAITFVIVRPDGYVGMVAPSTALDNTFLYIDFCQGHGFLYMPR
jgi:phenol 2-monooxygenase